MRQKTIEASPLLTRIQAALNRITPDQCILHVSVVENPKWEKSPNGDEILVRWLCWSVNDGEREVVPPEFEVVGRDVTWQRLERELSRVFEGVKVIVDNDIDA